MWQTSSILRPGFNSIHWHLFLSRKILCKISIPRHAVKWSKEKYYRMIISDERLQKD